MYQDYTTVALSHNQWTAVFMSCLNYLYTLVHQRNDAEPGSNKEEAWNAALREAVDGFMPVLKQATAEGDLGDMMNKEWYDFKLYAGMFPSEALEDNAKQLVYSVGAE